MSNFAFGISIGVWIGMIVAVIANHYGILATY
ncbi:hypothetical protein [Flyfo siphovirus Tbat2_3]|nr:hypothetical protein [Flyfo siphovirus Tbat2_3]